MAQMGIAGQGVFINQPVHAGLNPGAAQYPVSVLGLAGDIFQMRIMKFMRRKGGLIRGQGRPGAGAGFLQPDIAAALGPLVHDRIGGNGADHGRLSLAPANGAA